MLYLLHCTLLSLSSSQVPVHLGRRQRPLGCSMQHQPCTWANRGANSSKSIDGIWIIQTGQWTFQSNIRLNTHKCRVLSSPLLSPPSCLEDRSSPMSSSQPQQWGEHPSSSHRLAKLRPSSVHPLPPQELLKPAPSAPSHPTAFAAIYSLTSPQGEQHGDRRGGHTPQEPTRGPW